MVIADGLFNMPATESGSFFKNAVNEWSELFGNPVHMNLIKKQISLKVYWVRYVGSSPESRPTATA